MNLIYVIAFVLSWFIWDLFLGLGCDTAAVINILAHRNSTQRALIEQEYRSTYSEDLSKRLASELTGKLEVTSWVCAFFFFFEQYLYNFFALCLINFVPCHPDCGYSLVAWSGNTWCADHQKSIWTSHTLFGSCHGNHLFAHSVPDSAF